MVLDGFSYRFNSKQLPFSPHTREDLCVRQLLYIGFLFYERERGKKNNLAFLHEWGDDHVPLHNISWYVWSSGGVNKHASVPPYN